MLNVFVYINQRLGNRHHSGRPYVAQFYFPNMLFKFVLKNPFDIDEVHVWDWKFSLNTLTLDAIKAVICDLFAVPIGSVQRITWFGK